MYRKLINIEPDGSRKEFVLYTLKKGADRVVSLFISPASEKGRATLRVGENMWLYIYVALHSKRRQTNPHYELAVYYWGNIQ